eukprot:589151_1
MGDCVCMDSQPSESGCHLFMVVHGLFGWNSMESVTCRLESRTQRDSHCTNHATGTVVVAAFDEWSWLDTRDGIDTGGERLCEEISGALREHKCVSHLSFVCHSLGGLYSRYAAARLISNMENGALRRVEFVNFVTFGTPHLGMMQQRKVWSRVVADVACRVIGGKSGCQLILLDSDSTDDKPLIVQLSEGEFLTALSSFKKRIIVASIVGDWKAQFCTSAVVPVNIYKSLDQDEIPRIPGQTKIINRQAACSLAHGIKGTLGDLISGDTLPKSFTENTSEGKWLNSMFSALNELEWERIDCVLKWLNSMFSALNELEWERIDCVLKWLNSMFSALNELEWERIDCVLRWYFAHSELISRGDGSELVKYVISRLDA